MLSHLSLYSRYSQASGDCEPVLLQKLSPSSSNVQPAPGVASFIVSTVSSSVCTRDAAANAAAAADWQPKNCPARPWASWIACLQCPHLTNGLLRRIGAGRFHPLHNQRLSLLLHLHQAWQ